MATARTRRAIIFTRRQWVGLPILLGLPILALTGLLGPGRAGLVGRMALVYVLVLTCFRVLGKRELSQMSPIELVTLLFVAQLFRNAIMKTDTSMLSAIIAAFTLFGLVFLMSFLSYHATLVRRAVQSRASILVRDGVVDDHEVDQERVTMDDIRSAARKAGFDRLEDIHTGTLEVDGRISIVPVGDRPRAIPPIDR